MGVEIEAQNEDVYKQVRARELQFENIERLDEITEVVDNINLDGIESDTKDIKDIVINNLEAQPNIEEIVEVVNKIAQGISDIKRNQTNMNKKIKDLQETVDEIKG